MHYTVHTYVTLETDNSKIFHMFDDISFTVINLETKHHDRYIGRIITIKDNTLILDQVEINRKKIPHRQRIEVCMSDIEPNSCEYVTDTIR